MRALAVLTLGVAISIAACDDPSGGASGIRPEGPPKPAASGAPSAKPSASSAAKPAFSPKRVQLEEQAMGTHVLFAAYTTEAMSEEAIRPKLQKALDEIRRLQTLMTTWSDDSEISKINAAAGKQAVAVGPETFEVIQKSIWIGDKSEGVFDITFEAMKGLWKFDEGAVEVVPSKEAIEKARKLIDYRQIELDDKKRTVKLKKEGMRMSLGGIGKGYAIDAASRVLKAEGIEAFLAQAGGDLYVAGKKPDHSKFKVGVRDPRGKGPNDYFALIEVEDHAFSTAGDYERTFVKDGKRYHHIIDPRTGYPATASRSVTVWAKDAFTADAIDDAIFILGPEKGLKLVDSIEDAGCVIVDAKNKVWVSERIKGKVQMLREPTDGI